MANLDRKEDAPEKKLPDPNANEGEGSTSAAKQYDDELEKFKETSDVEKLAEEAARELEKHADDEGEEPPRKVA